MQQVFQFGHFAHAGQFLEHAVHIFTDIRLGGHQAVVGVHARIAGMVVTGAQVHITHQLVLLAAYHQNHFGMGFIADNAIHHYRTGFLQHVGNHDIGFFVEAGTQFNDRSDFLAITRRFSQYLHNFRVRTTAIQGLFNCQHMRIFGRFFEQADHRLKRIKRMMQQYILLFQHLKNWFLLAKYRRNHRTKNRIFQFRTVKTGGETRQVNRATGLIQLLLIQIKLI